MRAKERAEQVADFLIGVFRRRMRLEEREWVQLRQELVEGTVYQLGLARADGVREALEPSKN